LSRFADRFILSGGMAQPADGSRRNGAIFIATPLLRAIRRNSNAAPEIYRCIPPQILAAGVR